MLTATERADLGNSRHALQACDHRIVEEILIALDGPFITRFRTNGKPGNHFIEIVTSEVNDRLISINRVTRNLVQAVHHLDQRPVHIGTDDKLQVYVAPAVIR